MSGTVGQKQILILELENDEDELAYESVGHRNEDEISKKDELSESRIVFWAGAEVHRSLQTLYRWPLRL